ncbi:SDR family NAD(P)-dependent oxidoreductase [Phaeobacter gallaeciensis]|nr:SDR family NAD(P)-dependent oxidoreductase [Phaeobacter gallaeciensis]
MTKPLLNPDEIYFPDAFEQPTPQTSAVLVTGAAKRLGRAIATDLAASDWPVVIHYNASKLAADRLKSDIEAAGGRAEIVQADLSRAGEPSKLIERAENLCGPIGVLINNASVFEWDDLSTATIPERLQVRMLAFAVLKVAYCKGRIEFREAQTPMIGLICISALKGAVFNLQLTACLCCQLGSFRSFD